MDRQADKQMDGQTDVRMDGWMDEQTDSPCVLQEFMMASLRRQHLRFKEGQNEKKYINDWKKVELRNSTF